MQALSEFKKASTNDIDLIISLAKKSWEKAYSQILSPEQISYMLQTMYSKIQLEKEMKTPHFHYQLIFLEDHPIGFIGYEHHYELGVTKLHRLYLLEKAKGFGIGKLSLNFVAEEAKKNQNKRLILNVNKNNTAKKFYENFGFSTYDEGVFDIGEGFVMDDFLMEYYI